MSNKFMNLLVSDCIAYGLNMPVVVFRFMSDRYIFNYNMINLIRIIIESDNPNAVNIGLNPSISLAKEEMWKLCKIDLSEYSDEEINALLDFCKFYLYSDMFKLIKKLYDIKNTRIVAKTSKTMRIKIRQKTLKCKILKNKIYCMRKNMHSTLDCIKEMIDKSEDK